MYKAKELRDHTVDELRVMYTENCFQLFNLRGALRHGSQRSRPHQIRHKRKDIARILTILAEKGQEVT